jgi:hypothetical protein
MDSVKSATVTHELDGVRADKALAALVPEISRSAFAKLLEDGAVTAGGEKCDKHRILHEGDEVCFTLPEVRPLEVERRTYLWTWSTRTMMCSSSTNRREWSFIPRRGIRTGLL